MSTEKSERKPFERKTPTRNIGDIGKNEITKDMLDFAYQTFDSIKNNYEQYNRQLMQELISKYGEEEGQKRYAALKQDAEERSIIIQKLASKPESEGRHTRMR